jgi:hypothetical protein
VIRARPPEVGDLVQDEDGRHVIVTDIKRGSVWVLRPALGSTTSQWETDRPGDLHVIETRANRLSREEGA